MPKSLPNEILLEIIKYSVEPGSTDDNTIEHDQLAFLAQLSLVNRLFCIVVRPHLYRHVKTPKSVERTVNLLRHISLPTMVAHVKHLELFGDSVIPQNQYKDNGELKRRRSLRQSGLSEVLGLSGPVLSVNLGRLYSCARSLLSALVGFFAVSKDYNLVKISLSSFRYEYPGSNAYNATLMDVFTLALGSSVLPDFKSLHVDINVLLHEAHLMLADRIDNVSFTGNTGNIKTMANRISSKYYFNDKVYLENTRGIRTVKVSGLSKMRESRNFSWGYSARHFNRCLPDFRTAIPNVEDFRLVLERHTFDQIFYEPTSAPVDSRRLEFSTAYIGSLESIGSKLTSLHLRGLLLDGDEDQLERIFYAARYTLKRLTLERITLRGSSLNIEWQGIFEEASSVLEKLEYLRIYELTYTNVLNIGNASTNRSANCPRVRFCSRRRDEFYAAESLMDSVRQRGGVVADDEEGCFRGFTVEQRKGFCKHLAE